MLWTISSQLGFEVHHPRVTVKYTGSEIEKNQDKILDTKPEVNSME